MVAKQGPLEEPFQWGGSVGGSSAGPLLPAGARRRSTAGGTSTRAAMRSRRSSWTWASQTCSQEGPPKDLVGGHQAMFVELQEKSGSRIPPAKQVLTIRHL